MIGRVVPVLCTGYLLALAVHTKEGRQLTRKTGDIILKTNELYGKPLIKVIGSFFNKKSQEVRNGLG